MKMTIKYVGEPKVTKSTKEEFAGKQLRTIIFEDVKIDGEWHCGISRCVWEDSPMFNDIAVGDIVNI